MSKVIEQKEYWDIEISPFQKAIKIKTECNDYIFIAKENAREVAKAICPELETEIKSQEFEIKRLTKVYIESVDKNHRFQKEKLDFANWCRIYDSSHPNEINTIGQLLSKYEQTLLTNGKEVV